MNILIAIDSFKGTISSLEAAQIVKDRFQANHSIVSVSVGDGGEGTVDSIMSSGTAIKKKVLVSDAFGKASTSYYALSEDGKTAYMEVALSSGLGLIPVDKLNPMITTTYGLGETIINALNEQVSKIVIGIGGTSTNDAGIGMLAALGVKYFDEFNSEITEYNGSVLGKIRRIDFDSIDQRLKNVDLIVACDVNNPLLGPDGCAHVYAKQKGATPKMIQTLESNMKEFSETVINATNKDFTKYPGAGAAGGLGFGLITFLNATLMSGVEVVIASTNLVEKIMNADIVITGEGSIDAQSLHGKLPVEIAKIAKSYHKLVYGVFGMIHNIQKGELFDEMYAVVPTVATLEESLADPKFYFKKLVEKLKL